MTVHITRDGLDYYCRLARLKNLLWAYNQVKLVEFNRRLLSGELIKI